MQNVEMSLNGNILTLTVDLSQDFGLSTTEKSIIIASSGGNARIMGTDAILSLNLFRKNPDWKAPR